MGAHRDRNTDDEAPPSRGLAGTAKAFLGTILVAALVADGLALGTLAADGTDHLGRFAILAVCAAIAQLFVVITPNHQSYHVAIAFLTPAVLLLPWPLLLLVPIAQHLPEWAKQRYPWYIQCFNIANYTVACLAAWHASRLLLPDDDGGLRWALAGLTAAAVLVVVNHALLAAMLRLGRGQTLRQTRLFTVDSLSTDLVLALVGVPVALLWSHNPWLVPAAVVPLALIRRTLEIPALEQQAHADAKTGLLNMRRFTDELDAELARSRRFGRPLAVIMADLDLLRDVNNTHGHLAGDTVLQGMADVIRTQLRSYDRAGRFGGEEFVLLLPETTPEAALQIAERIRAGMAEGTYTLETSSARIKATVSIGVASFPSDGDEGRDLLHQADLAVYRAKDAGRNRVVAASPVTP